MAEVTQLGLEVFGNMEKFKLWLETPSYALGNLKPLELLKDSYGKEMVTGELTRINYGILS
jgi:putative toxin-antitoxin system antitoxin component (TIGR02293 family)